MPYTISHAAAVVPIWRRAGDRLPGSALVVGSFSPDLLYFLGSHAAGTFAHTSTGLLLLALPLGALLLILFHALLARPAILLFPPAHQGRLRAAADRPLLRRPLRSGLASIAAALLLGAATHVLWDRFTHDELATGPLAPLRRTLLQTAEGPVSIATALQYASSAVGLALLCLWYRLWCRGWSRAARAAAPPVALGPARRLGRRVDPELRPLPERTRIACLTIGAIGSPLLGGIWCRHAAPFSSAHVMWILGTTSAAFLLLCLFSVVVLAMACRPGRS